VGQTTARAGYAGLPDPCRSTLTGGSGYCFDTQYVPSNGYRPIDLGAGCSVLIKGSLYCINDRRIATC